jgi:hypothetical protein
MEYRKLKHLRKIGAQSGLSILKVKEIIDSKRSSDGLINAEHYEDLLTEMRKGG